MIMHDAKTHGRTTGLACGTDSQTPSESQRWSATGGSEEGCGRYLLDPRQWGEVEGLTEAVRIVVEVNASLRDDLEAAIALVEEMTAELATARASEAFTESELFRLHARAFDVTEALKAGRVEIVCAVCARKGADNG